MYVCVETVFGNITSEHRALKEKYFNTRKQDNIDESGTGNGSNDRDEDGDDGKFNLNGCTHTHTHTIIYIYIYIRKYINIFLWLNILSYM